MAVVDLVLEVEDGIHPEGADESHLEEEEDGHRRRFLQALSEGKSDSC